MTFYEFIKTRSLERDGIGSYEYTLIKESWERGAQAEREACAELVSDLVLHRIPASEYADRIRERRK